LDTNQIKCFTEIYHKTSNIRATLCAITSALHTANNLQGPTPLHLTVHTRL